MASICAVSRETILQSQSEFNNKQFVTVNLLPQIQIQFEVNATVNMIKNSAMNRINSFLNYIRTYTRANYFVSALNTNIMLTTGTNETEYVVYTLETVYTVDSTYGSTSIQNMLCGSSNPTSTTGFFPDPGTEGIYRQATWYTSTGSSKTVHGFYGGCTPFEALLQSALDCLYEIECLRLLVIYFPNLNYVCITFYLSCFTYFLYSDQF